MGIRQDQIKDTIEFVYEDPNLDLSMTVKFHHTPEKGEIISLSLDNEEWTDLPANLFFETVDFLRKRNNNYNQEYSNSELSAPEMDHAGEDLSLPVNRPEWYDFPQNIEKTSSGENLETPNQPTFEPDEEWLGLSENKMQNSHEEDENLLRKQKQQEAYNSAQLAPMPETPEEEKEKAKRMREERAQKIARNKKNKKAVFKSNHQIVGEEENA